MFKVDEDGSKPSSWTADGAYRADHLADRERRQRPRRLRRRLGRSPGAESWSSGSVNGLLDTRGRNVGAKPSSANFLIWWDGDPVRELLDATKIDKYGTEARHGCSPAAASPRTTAPSPPPGALGGPRSRRTLASPPRACPDRRSRRPPTATIPPSPARPFASIMRLAATNRTQMPPTS
ncbi:hypothetical protein [Micromonospora sp. WMMB482]|uniref:rhamnogalacturonan lyase family protein n=1 Tax=Micromonospora sp. WMMB482 TaxID=2849653 RepID=UPI0035AE0603